MVQGCLFNDRKKVQFSGKAIKVGEETFIVEHEIRDAFLAGGRVIVLYHPDACKGVFKNLECFSTKGKKIWIAELPEPGHEDAYYRIDSYSPLVLLSFTSFACQIDIKTGKIEKLEFTK